MVAPSTLWKDGGPADGASSAVVDPLPDALGMIYMMTIFELEKVIIVDVELVQAYRAILALEFRAIGYGYNLRLQLPPQPPLIVFDQDEPDQQENSEHDGPNYRIHVCQVKQTEVTFLYTFLVRV